MRMVSDDQGRVWRIWHVVPQSAVLIQTSPEMGEGWLCFESDSGKRRLMKPPAEWATLGDQDLLKLMDGAVEARKVVGMSGAGG
jgi:hypothetical protein